MKMSHAKLIVLSGLIWFVIGIYLLQLGLNLILAVSMQTSAKSLSESYPILSFLKQYFGNVQNIALLLVIFGLFVGYLKGRYVLGKSASNGVARILRLPNPVSILRIYNAKYYLLLGAMIGIGISIKYLGLPNDVRGIIDVTIGSALINGAIIYFKLALGVRARG